MQVLNNLYFIWILFFNKDYLSHWVLLKEASEAFKIKSLFI